ncbi:hypothetical protein GGF31_000505 [Allomyces arbusculus]|nr:hypothetical protein GGF31_000505 [Allomyces arbusculus]
MLRAAVGVILLLNITLYPCAQAANFKIAAVLPGDTTADPTRRTVVQFVRFLLNWTLPVLNQRLGAPAGHTFSLDFHDSLLTSRDTVRESLIAAQTGAVAAIGEWFSSNTIPMSYGVSHYGIFMCSGSATSEDLSDKTLHSRFFRTITADSYQGNVFSHALVHFGWEQFNLLAVNNVYGISVTKVIQSDVLTHNITVAAQYTLAFADPAEVTATVADLAKSPSRIVIMAVQLEQCYTIMAEAYAQGFDSSWVWIASESSARIAAKIDEKTSPMAMPDRAYAAGLRKFFEGMIVVWPQEMALGDATFNDWVQLYHATVGDSKILDSSYHLFSQSCLEAHMRGILKLDQTYGTNAVLQRTTNATLEEYLIPFNSSTGPVAYTTEGDRMGFFQLLNMQGAKLVPAMVVDSQFRISPLPGMTLYFPGNTITVPSWQPRFQLDVAGYDQPGVMVTLAFAGVSILAALVALVMLVVYRRSKRVRHLGLPFISALCVGLAVTFTTPFLWAGEPTNVTCNASQWTLILGMSLALASLAIRSYRLYRVFDNRVLAKSQSLGSRLLFARMITIPLIQVVLLSVAYAMAPLYAVADLVNSTKSVWCLATPATSSLNYILYCTAMALTILLFVGLAYLAIKTRGFHTTYSETRWLLYAMNIIAITVTISMPLYALYANKPVEMFYIRSVGLTGCCLCVLFTLVLRHVVQIPYEETAAMHEAAMDHSMSDQHPHDDDDDGAHESHNSWSDGLESSAHALTPAPSKIHVGIYDVRATTGLTAHWTPRTVTVRLTDGLVILSSAPPTPLAPTGLALSTRALLIDPDPLVPDAPWCIALSHAGTPSQYVRFATEADRRAWVEVASAGGAVERGREWGTVARGPGNGQLAGTTATRGGGGGAGVATSGGSGSAPNAGVSVLGGSVGNVLAVLGADAVGGKPRGRVRALSAAVRSWGAGAGATASGTEDVGHGAGSGRS